VGVGSDVAGVGAFWVPVLPADPQAAAPTLSIATQAIGAMRRPTLFAVVTLFAAVFLILVI
jgi:hypothetical protein